MQWHKYKFSKLWLFKKYMYHYQHVMGERADCGRMAAMCGRSTPLAGNADETSRHLVFIYIYGNICVQSAPNSGSFLTSSILIPTVFISFRVIGVSVAFANVNRGKKPLP